MIISLKFLSWRDLFSWSCFYFCYFPFVCSALSLFSCWTFFVQWFCAAVHSKNGVQQHWLEVVRALVVLAACVLCSRLGCLIGLIGWHCCGSQEGSGGCNLHWWNFSSVSSHSSAVPGVIQFRDQSKPVPLCLSRGWQSPDCAEWGRGLGV